jgi:hypothetical protein
LIFSRLEILLSTRNKFKEIFGRFLNCRVSLLVCTIHFYFPSFSVILVEFKPFIGGWVSFVIFLSFLEELHLELLVGVFQVEAHIVVEEENFLLSFFGIPKAPKLKLAHVSHDIGAAILIFQSMIKLDSFAIGLGVEYREYCCPIVLYNWKG